MFSPLFIPFIARVDRHGDHGSRGRGRGITISVCIREVQRKLFQSRRTGDGDGTARHGRGTGVPTFPAGQDVRGPGLLPDEWGDGPHDDGMAALQVELCARRSHTSEAHKCGCDGRRSTLRKKRLIGWADRMRTGWSSGGAGKDVHGDTLAFSSVLFSLFFLVIYAS